jgi:hypothetical protein
MVKVIKPRSEAKKTAAKKAQKTEDARETPLDPRAESLMMLSRFYLGEMDLEMKSKQMSMSEGKEVPVWMAALELMKDRIIMTEDPDLKLKMYQGVIDLLAVLGNAEEMRIIQEIVARVNLKAFKELGFERVEVECAEDACPECLRLAGKRFKIDDAVADMPLPCRECTTKKGAARGYCRCRYFAIF